MRWRAITKRSGRARDGLAVLDVKSLIRQERSITELGSEGSKVEEEVASLGTKDRAYMEVEIRCNSTMGGVVEQDSLSPCEGMTDEDKVGSYGGIDADSRVDFPHQFLALWQLCPTTNLRPKRRKVMIGK